MSLCTIIMVDTKGVGEFLCSFGNLMTQTSFFKFETYVLENKNNSKKTQCHGKNPDGSQLRHNDVIPESNSLPVHFSILFRREV